MTVQRICSYSSRIFYDFSAFAGRGIVWTPKNRRPEKLRDTLKECEVRWLKLCAVLMAC